MIIEFLRDRFGERVPYAVTPPGFLPSLPEVDDVDEFMGDEAEGESINGLSIVIEYRDAKGANSTRQVSCIRIERGAGKRYLRAFCHHRRQQRLFVIERVISVIDAETGEVLAGGAAFFADFTDDRISQSPPGWGLSPIQRADLGAGLAALIFLSRCDGEMHEAEIEEVETFVAAWWIRAEIKAEIPERDIAEYARRLAPDVEGFVLAAMRIRANPVLRPLVLGYARRVVEADGRVAPEENHWIPRLMSWIETD